MKTSTVNDFIDFYVLADKCSSLEEFEIEAVLHGKAHVASTEFFQDVVLSLERGEYPFATAEYLDMKKFLNTKRLVDSMRNRYINVPWMESYIASKQSEVSNASSN